MKFNENSQRDLRVVKIFNYTFQDKGRNKMMKKNNTITIPQSVRIDTELKQLLEEAKQRYEKAGLDLSMASLIRLALKDFGMKVRSSKEISVEMK